MNLDNLVLINTGLLTIPLTVVGFVFALGGRGERLRQAGWFTRQEQVLSTVLFVTYFYLVGYSLFVPIVYRPWLLLLGGVLYGVAFCLLLASYITFVSAPSQSVIAGGLFRYCRHPIYLCTVICLLGTCVIAGSLTLLVLVAMYALPLHLMVLREEEHCLEQFGLEYQRYSDRCRRYFWPF